MPLADRRRADPGLAYAATAAVGFVAFFITAYVTSFYLRTTPFPNSLSYYAVDDPHGMPTAGLNVGDHFFGDFLAPLTQTRGLTPYALEPLVYNSNYPPLIHVLFYPLTLIPYRAALASFLVLSAAAMLVPFYLATARRPTSERVLLLVAGCALTYPFLTTLDRGNYQSIVAGLLLLAAVALHREHGRRAAVLIGVSAGLKVYPILFAMVFVKRRQWSDLATTLVTFLVCLIVPALLLKGGPLVTLTRTWEMSGVFRGVGGAAVDTVAFNHSVLALLNVLILAASDVISSSATFALEHYSVFAAIAVVIMIAGIAAARAITTTEIVILMAAAMTTLPSTVGGYSLTVLFMPAALIILRRRRRADMHVAYAVLLGLLVTPKGFAVPVHHASLATFVDPLLCATLVVLVLVAALRRSYGSGTVGANADANAPEVVPRV